MAKSSSKESLDRTRSDPFSHTRWNWQLWIGFFLVLFICILAIIGPNIASRDPMEINYIVRHPKTSEFIKPPLSPFQVPGFPLGTDMQGRDLLSQLLWAVRPTIELVLLIAVIRLLVGVWIGLVAGWSSNIVGRLLEVFISAALALPVLFVALVLIAAIGIKVGSQAFIIGLTLTGWAESARFTRDLTRTIKSQVFIEAARALGCSTRQILGQHVLPQILPLVWTMLSFEISSALLTLAGLGLLGYFVNAIWVPLGDVSALRTSGIPELGQMLASGAGATLNHPWILAAAGSMIFLIVLGFNLLGEGMRLNLELGRMRHKKNVLENAFEKAANQLEERWFGPLSGWRRFVQVAIIVITLGTILALSGRALWNSQAHSALISSIIPLGKHIWPSSKHDPQGTLWVDVKGVETAEILWQYNDPDGFSGGPVIAADETLYAASRGGKLHTLNPDGSQKWLVEVLADFYGAPILNTDGNVLVLDHRSYVRCFSPQGDLLWTTSTRSDSAPLSGPVVDGNNTLYFVNQDQITAISEEGNISWQVTIPSYSYTSADLRLSADDRYLLFEDILLDSHTGSVLLSSTKEDLLDKYFIGTDGKIYLGSLDNLQELRMGEKNAAFVEYARWDVVAQNLGSRQPMTAGVIPDGRIWILYAGTREFSKLVWVDPSQKSTKGHQGQVLTTIGLPWRDDATHLVGQDQEGTFYICGLNTTENYMIQCRAYRLGQNEPSWTIDLIEGKAPDLYADIPLLGVVPNGGALAQGRMYVTTTNGALYAIGNSTELTIPQTQSAPVPTITPRVRLYRLFYPFINK